MKITIEGTPEEVQALMKKEPHGGEVLLNNQKPFNLEKLIQSILEGLAQNPRVSLCTPKEGDDDGRKK